MNWAIAAAGLLGGLMVGMTGMGGGALLTPMLILFFNIDPLSAVGSDLVVSLVMKPIGGGVHLRRGNVNKAMVGWLTVGSVPAAFAGVLLLKSLGADASTALKPLLGGVLLVAALAMIAKPIIQSRREPSGTTIVAIDVRPVRTIAIGAVGGLLVGLTSVGSGSLIIVMLLIAYPTLLARELVGTDLVQAIPLVASAALGHLLFGDVSFSLTGSLLVGGIPGVYVGARLSAGAPDRLLRPTLFVVLVSTGLKLVGAF
ncbi:MAG: sulfite exporter TauE/SafE family protein [Acidimicrobiales bacterium]